MTQDGNWGGETELGAIAEIKNLKQIPIYNSDNQRINCIIKNESGEKEINIQRINDNHYNAYIGTPS